jgi:hypothetical protein
MKWDEEDAMRIDDDDGDTSSDVDPCDRCGCARSDHEEGECYCGQCRRFKDVK